MWARLLASRSRVWVSCACSVLCWFSISDLALFTIKRIILPMYLLKHVLSHLKQLHLTTWQPFLQYFALVYHLSFSAHSCPHFRGGCRISMGLSQAPRIFCSKKAGLWKQAPTSSVLRAPRNGQNFDHIGSGPSNLWIFYVQHGLGAQCIRW